MTLNVLTSLSSLQSVLLSPFNGTNGTPHEHECSFYDQQGARNSYDQQGARFTHT